MKKLLLNCIFALSILYTMPQIISQEGFELNEETLTKGLISSAAAALISAYYLKRNYLPRNKLTCKKLLGLSLYCMNKITESLAPDDIAIATIMGWQQK